MYSCLIQTLLTKARRGSLLKLKPVRDSTQKPEINTIMAISHYRKNYTIIKYNALTQSCFILMNLAVTGRSQMALVWGLFMQVVNESRRWPGWSQLKAGKGSMLKGMHPLGWGRCWQLTGRSASCQVAYQGLSRWVGLLREWSSPRMRILKNRSRSCQSTKIWHSAISVGFC